MIIDVQNILGVLFGNFRGTFRGFCQGSKNIREIFTQENDPCKTCILITGTLDFKSVIFGGFFRDPGATPRKSDENVRKWPPYISGKLRKTECHYIKS